MSEEPSPEELKNMIDKALEETEKKRQAQASKVGDVKPEGTEEIEKVLEKKLGQK